MAEKVEFKRDVSNAVMGDLNEAPRQSNVVNLTIGSKTEFQPLTKLQRQDVTAKVKALVALEGGSPLNVYRVLLNSFGAANMDAFPGDKYMAAMELLDARIVAQQSAPVSAVALVTPPRVEVEPAIPCHACTRHQAEIKRIRAIVVAQWTLLVGAILFCGWLWLPSAVGTAPKSSVETSCLVDGKGYSMGSSIKMPNGSIRECMNNGPEGSPRWSLSEKK